MNLWAHSISWVDESDCANWMGDPPLHILRAVVRHYPLTWVIA